MTDKFFPADVSLRIEGDTRAAQSLFPQAKQLLYKTLNQQRLMGVPNANNSIKTPNGDLIEVRLAGAIKIVTVTPATIRVVEPVEPKVEFEEFGLQIFQNDMWSGVVRGYASTNPTIVAGTDSYTGESALVLDKFHPDNECAGAYGIEFAWQTPNRLAVNTSGAMAAGTATSWFPKPGMYSGSMKRLVAAILGLGNTYSETEDIEGNLPPGSPDVHIKNTFDPSWIKTHGIYKGDDGGVWLIQIGKVDGVLARPLPFLNDTDTQGFIAYIDSFHDTDTLNVLFEFGGLPSGETFPTGAALTTAITNGDILQLMTPTTLEPFYRDTVNAVDKSGLSNVYGWAFSESGSKAVNLAFWYKDAATALANSSDYYTDGRDGRAADLRYMMSQLWTIDIALTVGAPNAVGEGSAILSLVEEGPLVNFRPFAQPATFPEEYNAPMLRVGSSGSDGLSLFLYPGRPEAAFSASDLALTNRPVHAFYVNETLELVRNIAHASHAYHPNSFSGDSLALSIPAEGSVGLIVPSECREGYVLMKGDLTAHTVSSPKDETFPVTQSGFFPGLGVIEFTVLNEYYWSSEVFPGTYDMVTWLAKWLTRGEGTVTYATPMTMSFGFNINPGKSGGYVAHNGAAVPSNSVRLPGPTTVTRPAYSDIVQSVEIADLAIPDQTPPSNITFVGCP